MGIFDRFTNPVLHEFNNLSSQEKLEISFLITLQDYLRSVLSGEKELVSALEYVASTSKSPVFLKNGKRITPFSASIRERLIDELEIGFLTSSSFKTLNSFKFKIFKASEFISGLGGLVLAEINSRIGRKAPSTLEEAGYSQDPNECKVQVLIKWMEILGLDNSEFINHSSSAFFTPLWDSYHKNFFSGAITGFHRSDKEQLFKRAKNVYSSLSPLGKEIFSYLVKITRQKSSTPKESVKSPPLLNRNVEAKENYENKAERLFEEVHERWSALTGDINKKRYPWFKNAPLSNVVDMGKLYIEMVEPVTSQSTLYFLLVLIVIRQSGGNELYLNGEEYKQLENLVHGAAIKLIIIKLKNTSIKVMADEENLKKTSLETLLEIRKIEREYLSCIKKRIKNPEKGLVNWFESKFTLELDSENELAIKGIIRDAINETLKDSKE